MGDSRHILLCVAGITPQIITETLYALTQTRKERVDEVRVITTLVGRNRILNDLFDPNTGKFFAFCCDYGIDPKRIKFDETTIALLCTPDGRTLEDIRTNEENDLAADQICEIVRELTRDPGTRLHASVASGRKTMSIYLTAAMQLFGRAQDRLSHVLISEAFETHPEFYYIPPSPVILTDRQGQPLSTADARIHLAEIPFIRLRGARSDWLCESGRSYRDFVEQAQEYLDLAESPHELIINLRSKTVMVERQSAKLTEREFFMYVLFARLRQQRRGDEGFVTFEEITRENLNEVFGLITSARGERFSLSDYDSSRFDFVDEFGRQLASSRASDRKKLSKSFTEVKSRIKSSFDANKIPSRYLIVTRGAKGSLRYGLNVAPERIVIR